MSTVTTPPNETDSDSAVLDPPKTLTGVQISSLGGFTPSQVVRNEDLAKLSFDADWIVQRTGIQERRHAPPEMATSDMAREAVLSCLGEVGVEPGELELILVSTMTPDTFSPSTACHLQRLIGANCPAMDLNAACAGFIYGLVTGMQFVKTGTYNKVLVVGADLMSRICNPDDKRTYPLFGDGAGAALLQPGSAGQGLLSFTLGADGTGSDLLCIPGGGMREPMSEEVFAKKRHLLTMEGRAVFKWAVRKVTESVMQSILDAGLSPDELDLIVLHQANIRIIDAIASDLGIDRTKVFVNLDKYGNTSAASIPLVLHEAHAEGRLQRGNRVLLCGFGAGLTWGSAVLQW